MLGLQEKERKDLLSGTIEKGGTGFGLDPQFDYYNYMNVVVIFNDYDVSRLSI